jgi:hypothetical protein
MYSVRSDSLHWERLRTRGRPAAAIAHARERERKRETKEEEGGVCFKYELVAPI